MTNSAFVSPLKPLSQVCVTKYQVSFLYTYLSVFSLYTALDNQLIFAVSELAISSLGPILNPILLLSKLSLLVPINLIIHVILYLKLSATFKVFKPMTFSFDGVTISMRKAVECKEPGGTSVSQTTFAVVDTFWFKIGRKSIFVLPMT